MRTARGVEGYVVCCLSQLATDTLIMLRLFINMLYNLVVKDMTSANMA